MKTLTLTLALALIATSAFAQAKKASAAEFAGTWNIEMMSHQIALVVEPQDDTHVAATLMIMGTDQPLKGEVVDGVLQLVGVKPQGAAAEGGGSGPGVHTVPAGSPNAKPITVTLNEDGTISGEMQTQMGAAKFTGEKLKTKKKG
jgi:hypothetical protein